MYTELKLQKYMELSIACAQRKKILWAESESTEEPPN